MAVVPTDVSGSNFAACPLLTQLGHSKRRRVASLIEYRQLKGIGHDSVAEVIWVDMIAGIELLAHACGMLLVPDSRIEIDHRIKGSGGPNPFV
jgi:hypothetical protein